MEEIIVNLFPLSEEQRREMEALAPKARWIYADYHSVTPEQLQAATVIFGYPPTAPLSGAHALNWLQLSSVGYERYAAPGVLPEGVILTNARGAYGPAVSEHMLAMLLTLYKKLHLYRDNQANARWSPQGRVRSIRGSRALILGAGDIGSAFARLLRALGAGSAVGIRRDAGVCPDGMDAVYPLSMLDTLLPDADIVANVLPEAPETRGLFDARRLSLLRRDAVLLNCGRGSAVDLDALCDALARGTLAGAGLDVTNPEPLPPEHPLWGMEHVLITPHAAGNFNSESILQILLHEIAMPNLAAYLTTGRPCINIIGEGRP